MAFAARDIRRPPGRPALHFGRRNLLSRFRAGKGAWTLATRAGLAARLATVMKHALVGNLLLPLRENGRWPPSSACAIASAIAAPNPVSGPKPSDGGFQTAAPHAILIDADSGSVLFEKSADDLIPPASLSKLMTAEVVFNEIKQGRLKPTDEFIVSTNAWRTGGAPSRTSSMFIPIHSRCRSTISCTASSSSPATTPASRWPKGLPATSRAFAELMTKRAREIGLAKSTFGNSNGLPDPRQLHDRARTRQARAAHHRDLSRILQDLRRARIHLEQDPPVQPQSAAGA